MADGVGGLFGDGGAGAGGGEGGAGGAGGGEPKVDLEQFKGADGAYDAEKLAKSYVESRTAYHREVSARQALEKAAKDGVPETAAGYGAAMPWDTLKEKAPRLYTEGEVGNAEVKAFVEAAHKAGVKAEQVHAMLPAYFEARNAMTPEQVDYAKARDAAAKALTNGDVMLSDVQAWLTEQEKGQAFSEGQLKAVGSLLTSTDGLSVLHRLSRRAGSAAPPSTGGSGLAQTEQDARLRVASLYHAAGQEKNPVHKAQAYQRAAAEHEALLGNKELTNEDLMRASRKAA